MTSAIKDIYYNVFGANPSSIEEIAAEGLIANTIVYVTRSEKASLQPSAILTRKIMRLLSWQSIFTHTILMFLK